ncbi:hypothetical protein GSI_01685 [Ganoderma sinense ZZ0214-1]|uniref:Uncharacterized protein n=1 Tax=Ganoderma sinense ZZ0214-1 TaxID=1077348 RepID=A0A2G8SQI5_9APHY|nr:hypothetical protein GSI_01685 [Ganoderma sinense ZZ0214-1]
MDPLLLSLIGLLSLLLAHFVLDKGPQRERNRFSARAVVHPDKSAILEYTPPHPPHNNVNAVPSVTRVFNNLQLETGSFANPRPSSSEDLMVGDGLSISSALPIGKRANASALTTSSKETVPPPRAMSAPPRPPSRAPSVPPASSSGPPPIPPLNSSLWSRTTSRAGTPAPNGASPTPTPNIKPHPLTRSLSRLGSQPSKSVSAGNRSMSVPVVQPPTPGPSKPRPSALVVSKRHARKCAKNPRFVNVLPNGERPETAYFLSEGRKPLDEPPVEELMKKRPPLKIGDLYCHTTPSTTQIWIYLKAEANTYWEEINVGYVRELDGRMLSLTDAGKPNFVGDDWANKRQAKEEKRKNKGKGRAGAQHEDIDDDTDELYESEEHFAEKSRGQLLLDVVDALDLELHGMGATWAR